MESNGGNMQRGSNIATTNDRPGPPTSNDSGSIVTGEVGDTTSRSPLHLHDSEKYTPQAQGGQPTAGIPLSRNSKAFTRSQIYTNLIEGSQCRVLEPPVTKGTLSELDVNKIINNPKLRHDINFDPELHFRPNLDGEKGRRKAEKANEFWETMKNQLREYLTDRDGFEKEFGDVAWSLPATLRAIRGILETLVPQRDRASVEETFNVELLMQQFRKGVADMVKLANWLSQLLKCHCAPMRDDWVDEVVAQLSNGDRNGDVSLLALGMKNLLGVLEAMKLDVANHQIRCLRPLLIEDTVHFEQKFFIRKIALGRVDVAGAHAWFRRAVGTSELCRPEGPIESQNNTWGFMQALLNLILPSTPSDMVPHTFLFDEERLIKLRNDMQDLINLEICMYFYHDLEKNNTSQEMRHANQDDTPVSSFISSPCNRPASPTDHHMLSSPTLPLPHHFSAIKSKLNDQEGVHCVDSLSREQGSASSFTSDEDSTSQFSTTSLPETLSSTPSYLLPPPTESSQQVRDSLVAILSSSTATNKWSSLSSSLALQILRSTTTPLSYSAQFESHLSFHLSNDGSKIHQDIEKRILNHITPVLQKLSETYTSLSSLQVFESATSPKPAPANAVISGDGQKDEIAEIATRIAHIGIMHWRVWAHLAYLVDPDADEEEEVPTACA